MDIIVFQNPLYSSDLILPTPNPKLSPRFWVLHSSGPMQFTDCQWLAVTLRILCLPDYSYSPGWRHCAVVARFKRRHWHCSGAESKLNASFVDVGLSDHHLLTWSLPARQAPTSTQTLYHHAWRLLDVGQLRGQLSVL